MKSIRILLLLSIVLLYWGGHSDGTDSVSCNRKKLKGLYTYLASPTTFVFREENTMTERLGDIGVITEYDIRWQSKTSCDHQLIVKKVTTTSITPEKYKPYLLAVGDVLNITILEVTDKYVSFRTRYNDNVVEETMHRIPEEMLIGK
ncbi:MAG: hypothetical protein A3F72_01665 [Bacteroidetes bacterium RIFCSPLOWO2_12_FULL_35_15]|nr:MAG: hypothetical protein A3F72_01665 [Bacteroidetes bacterium RIFCSPLOWO2_12_FULL_35_15]